MNKMLYLYCKNVIIVLTLFFISVNVSGQIYQWTDKDGRIHFSDQPPEEIKNNKATSETIKVTEYIGARQQADRYPKRARLNVRQLFLQNKFQQLNQRLAAYQSQSQNNVLTEVNLFNAYSAFAFNHLFYQEKFQQWINATPNNYQPYLARATFYYSYGWDARGGKFIHKTTASQLSAMKKHFTLAKSDISKSLSIYKQSVLPYCLLIGIAKTERNSDPSAKKLLKQALRYNPASFEVRQFFIDSLLPRWGGSYQAMVDFAEKAQPYAYKNKNIKTLQGYALLDAANILASDKNYQDAGKLYNQILTLGDNDRVYYRRAKNYYRQHRYLQAITDFNHAIELEPDSGHYYYWRSKSYAKINKITKALTDINKASQLEPEDSDFEHHQQWLLSQSSALNQKPKQRAKSTNKETEASGELFYFNKAKKLLAQQKWQQAQYNLKEAIKLSPTTFQYYLSLDAALFKLDKLDEIIRYWGKYIKLKPTDSRAYLERSGTYYHKGDIDSSLKDLKKSAKLGNKEAQWSYEKLMTP